MKRCFHIKFAAMAVVIAPLIVGLIWRRAVGPCDFTAQGGLFLLMLVLPICTPLKSGFGKQFALFYGVGFVWGMWRMCYFDPVTNNDIPGMGYLIVPLMMGGSSAVIFQVRKWLAVGTSGEIS